MNIVLYLKIRAYIHNIFIQTLMKSTTPSASSTECVTLLCNMSSVFEKE
uniref:Uncharacterized protein n=1 Tax=Anguilla anguilla TaxID=7936 RepID=A0A0E9X7I2_ANGAN